MNIKGVALYHGVHENTVRAWIRNGSMRAQRVGRRAWFISTRVCALGPVPTRCPHCGSRLKRTERKGVAA